MLKKHIRDIYSQDVHSVTPDTPAAKAMGSMRENRISCIVVSEHQRPVGIFTERDVVRCIAAGESGFTDFAISEVMTPDVFTATPDMPLFEAFSILADNTIRHLVIVDDEGRAVGVVTQSDMIDHFGYDYFVKVKTVGQIMNKCPTTASATEAVFDAARVMALQSLSFLVVVDKFKPAGVLTERDISRLMADGVDIKNVQVKDVMGTPVITIHLEQPAYEATESMRKHKIRRLVVVDDEGSIVGVVTQTDLVKGLESKYIDTLKTVIKEQGQELDEVIRQLAQKTLYLDSILSSSINMGIAATDRNLKISYYNQAAEDILGVPARSALGRNLKQVHELEGVHSDRLDKAMERATKHSRHSFTFTRRIDSRVIYIQACFSAIYDKDDLIGYLLMIEDITEKRQAEETIRRLAYYDVLTGLPNRTLFYERLEADLARARRNDELLAILLMDLNRFKEVNDTYGHHVGDLLLKAVASRIGGLLRETDTSARVGGDEFCFILTNITQEQDVLNIGEKILERLDAPFELEGQKLEMTFSLGAALYPVHCSTQKSLMQLADQTMYRAKRTGRDSGKSHILLARKED